MSRTTRLLRALALGGAITLSAAAPAAAKAFSLDKVEITGPGLHPPLILSGRELWSPRHRPLASTLLPQGLFGNAPEVTTPSGWRGPRYRVKLQLRLHLFRDRRSVVVRQHLYPYASGGAVTLTPPSQNVRIVPRRFGNEVVAVEPGWHTASNSLVERLQRLGLPPAPKPSDRTAVSRSVRAEGFPWVTATSSLVVGAALLLGLRAAIARPRRYKLGS